MAEKCSKCSNRREPTSDRPKPHCGAIRGRPNIEKCLEDCRRFQPKDGK